MRSIILCSVLALLLLPFSFALPDKHSLKPRRQIHIRASKHEKDDVSDDFLRGMKAANKGGTLVLKKGKTYVIGKKMDLPVLKDFWMKLDGTILFTDDLKYWQSNYFYHPFQKSISFWEWKGHDIKIYGKGEINGNGQAWYDGFAGREILDPNNTFYRPILFTTVNATSLTVDGITFRQSPCWTTFLIDSAKILFNNTGIEAVTHSPHRPANTDGWDSYNVDDLTVLNSWVNVGDDCFSPKPNTTNIHVENIWCNGTHGISMGSIGQYPGVYDIIENVYVKNATLLNGENGVRLKAWAGENVGMGRIKNVTYEDVIVKNTDYPLVIDQCYFNIKEETCAKFPSKVDITDIVFRNVTGGSSGKRGRVTVELTCSPGAVCEGFTLEGIDIKSPKGTPQVWTCDAVKPEIINGGIGQASCISKYSDAAKEAYKG